MAEAALAKQGPSVAEQIAEVASMMPLSEYLKLRLRILKLGAFCDYMTDWL